MRSQIIAVHDTFLTEMQVSIPVPRYEIPYAEKKVLLLAEGQIIYQYYSTYLFLTELFELHLNKPLTFPYHVIDKALFVNFIL